MTKKTLIIKHGALGDWIMATDAFKLIAEQHLSAFIDEKSELIKLKIVLIVITLFLFINAFFFGSDGDAFYYWSWGQHPALGYYEMVLPRYAHLSSEHLRVAAERV